MKYIILLSLAVLTACAARHHTYKKYMPYSSDGEKITIYDHCKKCGYGVHLGQKRECTYCGKKK